MCKQKGFGSHCGTTGKNHDPTIQASEKAVKSFISMSRKDERKRVEDIGKLRF